MSVCGSDVTVLPMRCAQEKGILAALSYADGQVQNAVLQFGKLKTRKRKWKQADGNRKSGLAAGQGFANGPQS